MLMRQKTKRWSERWGEKKNKKEMNDNNGKGRRDETPIERKEKDDD